MRIVHVAPNAPYNDYWGYQENILPKYQKKLGHEVTLIVTNTQHENDSIVDTECADYKLNDGVRVIKVKHVKCISRTLTSVLAYMPIYQILISIKPDFVFFHGLLSISIFDVIRYKKVHNTSCIIVQDNHLDYNIGMTRKGLKKRILRWWYKLINHLSIKHISRVYGVTPWRKKYAEDYFGIPSIKTDVLQMGADDEKIDFSLRNKIRHHIRNSNALSDTDFVIVTGGRIDEKKKIHLLIEACNELSGVKLLIFGKVTNEFKEQFDQVLETGKNTKFIGWINSDMVYEYFLAADLAVFPGQHSVLWEQACAAKVPCVFGKWEGMDHVNVGGNAEFISPITVESIREKIIGLHYTPQYDSMKKVAESDATNIYLYSRIAEKSLECANKST